MKFFNQQVVDQIYEDRSVAVDLLKIYLVNSSGVSTPLFLTNSNFDIRYNNITYTAQGEFLNFSNYTEELDVKIGRFSVTLSAVNNDYLNKFTSAEIEGRQIVIEKAFLQYNTLEVIPDPILLYDGNIMNIVITESASTCNVTLDCSTLFADFERRAGRYTNNNSNWLMQGTKLDRSFEKAGWVGNSEIAWGRTK